MAYFFANIKILHIIECNTAFWKEDLYKSNGYNEKVTRLGYKDNELVCILINSRTEKKNHKI